MTSRIIVNVGTAKSSSAHTPSNVGGTVATLTFAGEAEWSKEDDEICWLVIKTMERHAPRVPWPSADVWREAYLLRKVATPPQGRTEGELRRRCITLVDQRHAQRLAQAQATGDKRLSAIAQQPKSPAQQLNVTLPSSQAETSARKDTSNGEIEEAATSKESNDADAEEDAEASSQKKGTKSKPAGIHKSITQRMKAARRRRKPATMVLKGNFESFKVKKVGRRSKIITFRGKGTIRVPL